MASTIYEVSKPQQQFYSVERAGFVDVGEAMFSAVTDLIQLGFFQVKVVKFIDRQNNPIVKTGGSAWPVSERVYTLSSVGSGYKAGDQLYALGGTLASSISQKAKLTVNSISSTGGILTYTVNTTGEYSVVPGPAANVSLVYETPTTVYKESIMLSNVANSDGTGIVIPTTNNNLPDGSSYPTTWRNLWGVDGGGGTSGTRWPTTGFWIGDTSVDVRVGSEVILLSGSANSSIPPGTTITKKSVFNRITGVENGGPATGYSNEETTTLSTYFETSVPITLVKGDSIGFRGQLATIDNTVTERPKAWRAILETTAAVDPLSDTVGVFANVAATSSSSTLLQVNSLTTPNAFNPVIYPGQRVTSTLANGSVSGFVTVVSVTKTGATSANVVLSSAQTFSQANEPLRFVFPADPQNWRIAIDVRENKTNPDAGPQKVEIYAGTSLQLKDTGELTTIFDSNGALPVDRAGLMGAAPTGTVSTETFKDGTVTKTVSFKDTAATDPKQGFLNREKRVGASGTPGPEIYPLNYLLTLTNRGIFFGMWEGNWSTLQKTKAATDNYFNWFLIQRPVNRNTGQVLTTGTCPVFCINSAGYDYWKMIVREKDVLHPTQGDPDCQSQVYDETTGTISTVTTRYRVPADAHSQDSFAIINSTTQISLTEDSKYLISLLHDLTTPRFRFTEELDMVGQTSADVCMAGNDLSMTTYSESGPRIYHAMPANNPYNSGLRIVVLKNIP
jgi:hypothetical protein